MTTKNFADGHVIQTAANGSQQLALGYVHRQVDFQRFEPIFALSMNIHVRTHEGVADQTFKMVINLLAFDVFYSV